MLIGISERVHFFCFWYLDEPWDYAVCCKINNPTFDVVNDVNQDFPLKYSNNKMGINDVINKLSINNTYISVNICLMCGNRSR
jgi:hypothetical protein